MGTIFVADGASPRATAYDFEHGHTGRERKLSEVRAYLYGGSKYIGWGTDEHTGLTGFFFDIPEHAGFGPDQTLDRLASGLHFGHREP